VKYRIVNGQRIVGELETENPPGSGDNNHMGKIEQAGDDSVVAAGLAAGDALWRIGGKTYLVTPSTDLDDSQGALEVGSTALVNSYTATDGTQVATQISGIDVTNAVYLPMTTR
jgi:hypothetical protein